MANELRDELKTAQGLRTELARYAHDQSWVGWMRYMFSVMAEETYVPDEKFPGAVEKTGNLILPKYFVERWKRQSDTPFDSLPEGERKSDYDEADKILLIVDAHWLDICGDCDGEGDMA